MLDHDQLRLAAAVAHVVPRAELRLRCGGDELVVSRHPAGDLTPCAFRQLLIESARPDSPLPAGASLLMVEALSVGGSLGALGGGVLRSRSSAGREQRWLGSTLPWQTVRGLLESSFVDGPHADELEATVAPDGDLDVTLIRLDATTDGAALDVDRIASAVSASLLADELILSVGGCVSATPIDRDR